MALTVEDGTGKVGADSYVATATIDAYWTARPQLAYAAAWAAAGSNKEGAAREASAALDALFGDRYRGRRLSGEQGLEWPRADAKDAGGYPLPALPQQIVKAVCELAGRAVSGELLADQERGGRVQSEAVSGAVSVTYFDDAANRKVYPLAEGLLKSVLRARGLGFA